MKTRKYLLPLVAIIGMAFIGSCSSSKKTASTPTTPERHFSAAELEEGKTIMEASCKRCHKLYAAESHTPSQWNKILPRMNKRAKLNEEQAAKVRGYIMSIAQK